MGFLHEFFHLLVLVVIGIDHDANQSGRHKNAPKTKDSCFHSAVSTR